MTSPGRPDSNDRAHALFTGLDPSRTAFLFDIDGTLIDIGPSPFEVDVPQALKDALLRLHARAGGALALVSGRPVADIDILFAPLRLPAVGGHGAETRLAMDGRSDRIVDLPAALREFLVSAVTPGSGLACEDKGYSVALHYRKAPHEAERLRRHVAAAREAFPRENTELLLGKAMFEVKRPGVNKGDAVRGLMAQPPFAGRAPVFLGDDVTDESVFDVMPALAGTGFGVGRAFPSAAAVFSTPRDVRAALASLSGAGSPPMEP